MSPLAPLAPLAQMAPSASQSSVTGRVIVTSPPESGLTVISQRMLGEPFETVQQLRLALLAFKDRYNQKWLVERHGHRTPAAVRQALSPSTGAAA